MAFRAVLDACVLYPFSLRDTLLHLAERDLYEPIWSARILEETRRNLTAERVTPEQADRLIAAMRTAFDAADADAGAIAKIEPALTNEAKDRHVLAAAVVAEAPVIVTFNLRDFPAEACAPHGVSTLHPDDFLLLVDAVAPAVVVDAIRTQVASLTRPVVPLDELLDALGAGGVPRFAASVRRRLVPEA
jgi:hypothetical protein